MKFRGNSTSVSRVVQCGNRRDDVSRYLLFEASEKKFL
jgi:hypothetical protein